MSASPVQAVFLDVDGVLIDSLPQHLRICSDKATQYGLTDVVVPDVATFRTMVASGVKVSPMLDFFRAVGFPEDIARRAVSDYEREFVHEYAPAMFAGTVEMLSTLHQAGLALGLVTANTRANVEPALAPAMGMIDPRCRFYFDSTPALRSKAAWLVEGARRLQCTPEQCVFVGDQPADAAAAGEAGCRFIGVTYGWGFVAGESRWPMAHSVADIAEKLLRPNLRSSWLG